MPNAWVQAGVEYLDEAAAEFDSHSASLLCDDWEAYRRDATLFMEDFDILLSPIAPGAALPHGDLSVANNYGWSSYASIHNLTGWPAAVVRAGTSREGLPLGVQVVGPAFTDRGVLQVGALLEQEFGGFVALTSL